MLTTADLLRALRELAAQGMPELLRIYAGPAPEEAPCPCLSFEPITAARRDSGCNLVEVEHYLLATVYPAAEEEGNYDGEALAALQWRVMDLFRPGYLKVGDRSLRAGASTGGSEGDRAFVDIQLSYFEVRDDTPDNTPLIMELALRHTDRDKTIKD